MSSWWIEMLKNLALAVGLPLLQKLLPTIPQAVWDLIKSLINYVHASPNPAAAAKEVVDLNRQCAGVACHLDTLKI